MGSVNKVILVGNLGRDAELRYTPGGAAVATFNMATTEVWNDKAGQRQERTEWHHVDLWGKPAESLTEYLVKGKQVYVEGRLQTASRPTRTATSGRAPKVRVRPRRAARRRWRRRGGGGATDRGGDGDGRPRARTAEPSEPLTDDDIPF